jgi:DNA-binding SARP family transcriptional activator
MHTVHACVSLLGRFGLTLGAEAVRLPMTAQRLLAFLAIEPRPLLRTYVAGCLWPETSEEQAGGSLRSALWRVGLSGYELVTATGGYLELAPGVTVDYRSQTAVARRLLDGAEPSEGSELDVERLSDDLLPDWSEDWVLVERERFRQLRLHALEAMCEGLTALGRYAQAIEAGLMSVAAEPLRESAHRALMKAYLAEGNVSEALTQFRVYRKLLQDELGLEPTPEMEALLRDARVLTLR